MDLSYREMTVDDLPAAFHVRLSTVENAATMEELEHDYGVTLESYTLALNTHSRGWLCEDSGSVVGFASGNGSSGEIQVVAVLPVYENRGIGGELLRRIQEWLFSEGHDEIWLLANPDETIRAFGFYRRFGWRPTGQIVGGDEVMRLSRNEAQQR